MAELLQWLLAHQETLVLLVSSILTVASLVVALTPTEKDDSVVDRIKNVWEKVKAYLPGKK